MSFNTIYYGSFNDNVNDDRIDVIIKQAGFTGYSEKLKLANSPVIISYPSKEWDEPLIGCGVKINVINDSGDFYKYDSLFSVPERSNYVEIIKTPSRGEDPSIFLFQGYILPDLYTSKLGKNITLTIPATDRLTTLDRYTPAILTDTSIFRSDEYVNANDIILTSLMDADVTNKFMIHNTLENVNYVKDPSSCVFDNVFFQNDNFKDAENIENSKKCLEKIFRTFYSRCYYHNGRWYIDRISDMGLATRNYTYYPPDASTTRASVTNTKIDLTCGKHEIISGSPELAFNPGYNKIVVNLKYKKPESLVENYFYDIQPLDPSRVSNGGRPMPGFREWMVSATSLERTAGIWDGFFSTPDASLWTYPITWNPDFTYAPTQWIHGGNWGTPQIRAEWGDDQTLTTMFTFSPQQPNESLILDVAYKVAIDRWQSGNANSAFLTRFALRAVDRNGKDWWIAKSNFNDTSTYWKDTLYTFDTSIMRTALMAQETNLNKGYMIWDIKKNLNISSPILTDVSIVQGTKRRRTQVTLNDATFFYPSLFNRWVPTTYTVPTNPQYIAKLYLDVYMFERTFPGFAAWQANYNPYYAFFGDFDVDIKTEVPRDFLEASMGYHYNTITRELEIFDTSTIMFTNGLYNVDASLVLRSIGGWRDSAVDSYIPIQFKYIEDMAQMCSTPKYKFTVDVRSKDTKVWNMGNLFTHTALRYPDTSLMAFMVNGMEYNVKENTYRLDLLEYIDDYNWRVDPPVPQFYIDPCTLEFTWDGLTGNNRINATTNVDWSWDIGDGTKTWAGATKGSNYLDVSVLTNVGVAREVSLYFMPTGMSTVAATIKQNASTGVTSYIEFTSDGSVFVGGLATGVTVDLSVYGWATAYACSYYSNYSATAESGMAIPGINVLAFASVNPTIPNCASDTQFSTMSIKGITNASTNIVAYVNHTEYEGGMDGEQEGWGYLKITSAKLSGTSTDVSVRYNTYTVDSDGNGTRSNT
jgi:hypothetical protein